MDYLLDKNVQSFPSQLRSGQTVRTEKAGLAELTEYCHSQNIIYSNAYHLLNVIRNYRNLIHPNKAIRTEMLIGEKEAIIYKSSLDMIIDEISIAIQKEFGSTADQMINFVISEENASELFRHMAIGANSEDERIRFQTDLVQKRLGKAYENYLSFFDSTGEININSYEEVEELNRVEELIDRLSKSFKICFQESTTETKRLVAQVFLSYLKSGNAIEKHYIKNIFIPEYIDFLSAEDSAFVLDYMILISKRLNPNVFGEFLHYLEKRENTIKSAGVVDGYVHHVQQNEANQLNEKFVEYMNMLKRLSNEDYQTQLRKLFNLVENGSDQETIMLNDVIISIFTNLNEEAPEYIPF